MMRMTRNIGALLLAAILSGTAIAGEATTVTRDFEDVLLVPGASVTVTIEAQVNDPVSPGTESVSASATLETTAGQVASNTLATPIGPDVNPPVLALNGEDEVTVECATGFTDPGATAEDDRDGDLTGSIERTGEVDTAIPGLYQLTYTVRDTAGNAASLTRIVTVVDTTPPTLAFVPGTDFTLCRSSGSLVPEVVASDNCASLVTTTVEGVVDLGVAGIYPITATADDGFQETVLTRNFSVIVTGGCPTICEIIDVDVLNAAETYLFPSVDQSAPIRIEAAVDRIPESLCASSDLQVWFEVGDELFEAEPIEDRFFADLEFGPGRYNVFARASLGEGFPIVSDLTTFDVVAVGATGSAGLPTQPQRSLVNGGDRWTAEDEVPGCLRSAGGVHLTRDNIATEPPLSLPLADPFAGTVEISWPEELLLSGESMWLFASASCTPDAVLSPADGSLLEAALPITLDGEWPVLVVHALIEDVDGNLSLTEAAARLAANPLIVRIFGFDQSSADRTVQGYGVDWQGDENNVALNPGEGIWSEDAASGVDTAADGITFEVRNPGAFAIFETVEMADLAVTPSGNSRVLGVLKVGEPFDVTFTLSNVGGMALTGQASVADGVGDAAITAGEFYTLEPAEQATVVVTVTPTETREQYEAVVTLTGDPDGPRTITLRASVSEAEKEMRFLGCGARPEGGNGLWSWALLGALLVLAAGVDRALRPS